MTLLSHLVTIGIVALLGFFVSLVIKEKGAGVGAFIFAAVAVLYYSSPRYTYAVSTDEPVVTVRTTTFTSETDVQCRWRVYDHEDGAALAGWCTKDGDGHWYQYLVDNELDQ